MNKLTGHRDSRTREGVYMDDERDEDQAGAARTRRTFRLDLAGQPVPEEHGEAEKETPQPTAPEAGVTDLAARLMALDPEARETLLAMLNGAGA